MDHSTMSILGNRKQDRFKLHNNCSIHMSALYSDTIIPLDEMQSHRKFSAVGASAYLSSRHYDSGIVTSNFFDLNKGHTKASKVTESINGR